MKKHIFLFILFPSFLFSQVVIQAPATKQAKVIKVKRPDLLIKTQSSDILFKDALNPFELVGKNLLQYTVSITNGTLIPVPGKQNDTLLTFNILVDNQGPTFVDIKGGTEPYHLKYRNKPIPTPVSFIMVGNKRKTGGSVPVDNFRNSDFIGCGNSTYEGILSMVIKSATVTKISADNQRKSTHVNGPRVTDQISDAVPGDIFIFHDIMVETSAPNTPNQQMQLADLVFFVDKNPEQ